MKIYESALGTHKHLTGSKVPLSQSLLKILLRIILQMKKIYKTINLITSQRNKFCNIAGKQPISTISTGLNDCKNSVSSRVQHFSVTSHAFTLSPVALVTRFSLWLHRACLQHILDVKLRKEVFLTLQVLACLFWGAVHWALEHFALLMSLVSCWQNEREVLNKTFHHCLWISTIWTQKS